MKLNEPYSPTLADHLAIEHDEQTAIADEQRLSQALDDSGIRRVEKLLEGEMSRRVTMLTAEQIGAMSHHEQIAMERWIKRRLRLFGEKHSLLLRHMGADVDVPEVWRKAGVA